MNLHINDLMAENPQYRADRPVQNQTEDFAVYPDTMIPHTAAVWADAAISTAPTERSLAERYVRQHYDEMRYAQPEEFLWFSSPIQGCIAAALTWGFVKNEDEFLALPSDVRANVEYDALISKRWVAVPDLAHVSRSLLELDAFRQVTELSDRLNELLTKFRRAIPTSVVDTRRAVYNKLYADLGRFNFPVGVESFWYASIGALNASVLASCDFLLPGTTRPGFLNAALNAGWWWPCDKGVIMTERPSEITIEDGWIHNPAGPAIRYRDGWSIWAHRGIVVDAEQSFYLHM